MEGGEGAHECYYELLNWFCIEIVIKVENLAETIKIMENPLNVSDFHEKLLG